MVHTYNISDQSRIVSKLIQHDNRNLQLYKYLVAINNCKKIKFYKPKFLFISTKIQKILSIQKKKRKHLSEPDKISPKKYSFFSSNNKNSKNQETSRDHTNNHIKKGQKISLNSSFSPISFFTWKKKRKKKRSNRFQFQKFPTKSIICII